MSAGKLGDAVVEAGQRDAAIGVVQAGQHVGQHMQRVARGAAIHARMQVAIGAGDGDFLADQTAQRHRDRRMAAAPHVGVADKRQIGGQLLRIGGHERRQVGAARFLLAFEQHGDARRQLAGHRLPGADRLDEGHQLALVVGGAARRDHLDAVALDDLRLEGRRFPEIERIDRLHVVMAVEQEMGSLAGMVADDDRVAGRRPGAGFEAKADQVGGKPLGRLPASGCIGRIGRDAFDAQQFKQPVEACRQVGVDPVEDVGEHGW